MSKFSDQAKNTKHQKPALKRLLWLLFEIGIGLLVVAGALFWAEKYPNKEFPAKWLGLGLSTLVLFGYLIYWEKKYLARWRFWIYWLGFLCVHLIAMGWLVSVLARAPLILFVFTTIGEASLMVPVFIRIEMNTKTEADPTKN